MLELKAEFREVTGYNITIPHKVKVNTNEIHGKTEAHSRKIENFRKKEMKILELKNIISELNNSLDRLSSIMEMIEELVYL